MVTTCFVLSTFVELTMLLVKLSLEYLIMYATSGIAVPPIPVSSGGSHSRKMPLKSLLPRIFKGSEGRAMARCDARGENALAPTWFTARTRKKYKLPLSSTLPAPAPTFCTAMSSACEFRLTIFVTVRVLHLLRPKTTLFGFEDRHMVELTTLHTKGASLPHELSRVHKLVQSHGFEKLVIGVTLSSCPVASDPRVSLR